MSTKRAMIDPAIFAMVPDFHRALVIVRNADNAIENPAIAELLRDVVKERFGLNVEEHPAIRAWNDAHRKFGSNPNKYPPSVKALLKRIAGGREIPFINSAVALFNVISIKYAIPCGGDDLERIDGDLVLGVSDGSETFVPLGQEATPEHPDRGEVIYFDSANKQVMCRRWNWRNGDTTKIQPSTRCMLINIDCLPPVAVQTADSARDELAKLFEVHCNAQVAVDFLDRDRPAVSLPAL